MAFKQWLEQNAPETASAEVERTGLQPQVNADEIDTESKRDDDKLLAIDAGVERLDSQLPDGDTEDPKINKFKKLWDKFRDKWEEIKIGDFADEEEGGDGLGDDEGDQEYLQMMQKHKNMVPQVPQPKSGPGTFGLS